VGAPKDTALNRDFVGNENLRLWKYQQYVSSSKGHASRMKLFLFVTIMLDDYRRVRTSLYMFSILPDSA
jgi:hypothetical protein